jgi:peptidoglycan DL-endopeptidase CwlO
MSSKPIALAIATVGLVITVLLPLPAGGSPAPSSGTIESLQQRAAALETQISTASENEQIAGELYDQATVKYQLAEAKLKVIHKQLTHAKAETAASKRRVRRAAVAAYVFGDSVTSGFNAVLTKSVNESGEVTTYANAATGELSAAVAALTRAEAQVQANAASQSIQTSDAAKAVAQAARSQANAESDATTLAAALSQAKGRLATAVAERAAQLAAEARQKEEAAAAARAREQQASEDAAAVAQAVANSNPSSAAASAAATAAISSATAASAAGAPTLSPYGSTRGGDIAVSTAESLLGIPYVWGGSTASGVDCSGLTLYAWAAAGVALLHSAWYQYLDTKHVSLDHLEPGDLLFYYFPNDGTDPVTHVAMYVGSGEFGTQTVIQAPETGETVSYVSFYTYGFVGAGRPQMPAGDDVSTTTTTPPPTTTTTTTTTTSTTTTTLAPTTTTLAPATTTSTSLGTPTS